MTENRKKVILGMSGGVDSSVAAYLLMRESLDVIGVTLLLYGGSADGPKDAEAVCSRLNIEHKNLDFAEDFKKEVIGRFICAYQQGLTPNPCIDCNRYIKFAKMLDKADELGADFVATGHYARVEKQGSRYLLKKAVDLSKDQSYVLYSLKQYELSRIKFPLGEYSKAEVREIAEENGFVNAHKHESQDICFVPDGDYFSFIEKYTDRAYPHGDFVDMNGNRLGEHKGIIRYTIGQRRGLGLALPASMYVVSKDIENNRVILGFNEDLFTKEVNVKNISFTACDRLDSSERLNVKIRYNQKEQPATVTQTDENHLKIIFDEPQRAVTKGQAAVLYDGDTVVGGGTIY